MFGESPVFLESLNSFWVCMEKVMIRERRGEWVLRVYEKKRYKKGADQFNLLLFKVTGPLRCKTVFCFPSWPSYKQLFLQFDPLFSACLC